MSLKNDLNGSIFEKEIIKFTRMMYEIRDDKKEKICVDHFV
jgi:hypothetical protein